VLLLAVLMTQSRGSILGTIAGLAVIAFLAGNARLRLWFAAGAAALVAALALGTPLIEHMIERGPGLRPALWMHHLQLATQSPWIGHGLSFDVSIKEPGGGELSNAHNIFLSAFVRGGIFAAMTLAALVAVCLYRSFEAARRIGVVTPLALMVTATVATSFDYEIAGSSLGWPWLLFWLPVGMSLAAASREPAEPSQMA
jgi:O-antigen ligase